MPELPEGVEMSNSDPEYIPRQFKDIGKAILEGFESGIRQGEVRTTSSTGGEKGVKPERMDLIPVEALEALGRLYGFGAEKYSAHNWRKGYEFSKSYAALQRHANAFWRGEDTDSETGESHMASVVFHAFALMIFVDEHPDFDDRYKGQAETKESEETRSGPLYEGYYREFQLHSTEAILDAASYMNDTDGSKRAHVWHEGPDVLPVLRWSDGQTLATVPWRSNIRVYKSGGVIVSAPNT